MVDSIRAGDFSDPVLAEKVISRIRDLRKNIPGTDPFPLMEVCGTHSHVLGKSGIRDLLKDAVEYRSGPGCPVCVTDPADLDTLIRFSLREKVRLVMFGDLLRVPGTQGSLMEQRARGAVITLVYSPLDALELARENPDQQVVFVGSGFETTAPGTALLIMEAKAEGLGNLSVFSLHKLMPPVLRVLLESGFCRIGGLILPGHVSVITGRRVFDFLGSELGYPSVIAGFEPLDLLHATAKLLEMAAGKQQQVVNGYPRVVGEEGNIVARRIMDEIFVPEPALWRGLGCIGGSGLGIRPALAGFDARRRFDLNESPISEDDRGGCRCSEVLRGEITPPDCPLFGKTCTPDHPQGACMVSSEGACSSYF